MYDLLKIRQESRKMFYGAGASVCTGCECICGHLVAGRGGYIIFTWYHPVIRHLRVDCKQHCNHKLISP